jgi:hypothetical protein
VNPKGVGGRGCCLLAYLVGEPGLGAKPVLNTEPGLAESGLDSESVLSETVLGEVGLDTEPVLIEIEGKFPRIISSNDDSNVVHVLSLCNLLISWFTISL